MKHPMRDRRHARSLVDDELREFERRCAAEYLHEIGADRPADERRERALRLAEGAPTRRLSTC